MECKDIKNLIPDFLSGNLGAQVTQEVLEHVSDCQDCNHELSLYKRSWEALDSWEDVEPERGYVSRFWTRMSMRKPWYTKIYDKLLPVLNKKNMYPAFAVGCVLFIVAFFAFRVIYQVGVSDTPLAYLSLEEVEFVENIDLVQDLEIIEDMEFFENLDIIENMEGLEV